MIKKLLGITLLALAGNAWAAKDVLVENAWLRESVPGQTTASVQLNLTAATQQGKLVALSSPVAKSGEMQRLYPSGGQIRTIVLKNVKLPRGRAVAFGDRTISLMLIGLKQPLAAGDKVPFTLTVELADKQQVKVDATAEVRPLDLSYKHYQSEEVHDHQ